MKYITAEQNQKRERLLAGFYILGILLFLSISLPSTAQLIFEKEEYAARREKLMDQIPDGFLVIRGAAMPSNFTQFYQYNNLMYLSGVEIPDVVLVIDGRKRESTLFLTISENHARSEGINLRVVQDPISLTGIEHVLPLEEFTSFLEHSVKDCKRIYAPFYSNELMAEVSREKTHSLQKSMTEDEWDGRETREIQFVNLLKNKYPDLTVRDCSPMIWDQRKIKSKAEIDLMRECGRIGVEAHLAFMSSTGVDVSERSLANIFEYTCKEKGANGLAYNTIIMSGLNHAFGHYHRYDRTLKDGDFIILDAGPDYKYYDVDISTTFPANGKFSPLQKESYELALLVSETCIKNYKPGITLADVGQKVKEVLIENGYDPTEKRFQRWLKYGGYNHSIGMAVHDGMGTFAGTDEVLQPGFVFACDIMTRADSVTSVRIEDTMLITEDGCEVLSAGLPRSVKEIEDWMGKQD
jgi:Xaa-Pro aminopeptidase